MNRKNIVAGNWKMNKDYKDGMELISEAVNMIRDERNTDTIAIFATPFIHLSSVSQLIKEELGIYTAAQNCHQEESGAYTGEISAAMIRSVGASYVIIGHSERRNYFQEDHELLRKKVQQALKHDLTPIFCIGETLEERNAGSYFEVIAKQLNESLYHLSPDEFSKIVLAYEPVWAIGTGLTASPEQAQEIHAFIRKEIAARFGDLIAAQTSILYGGSCNPQNAASLFSQPDIDGGLIGGASLQSRDFTNIVTAFNPIRK